MHELASGRKPSHCTTRYREFREGCVRIFTSACPTRLCVNQQGMVLLFVEERFWEAAMEEKDKRLIATAKVTKRLS